MSESSSLDAVWGVTNNIAYAELTIWAGGPVPARLITPHPFFSMAIIELKMAHRSHGIEELIVKVVEQKLWKSRQHKHRTVLAPHSFLLAENRIDRNQLSICPK